MSERPQHLCHAFGCKKEVPPRMLMCLAHWRLCPAKIQREVWHVYRPGQEITKAPSEAYLLVAKAAIWAVYVAEYGIPWSKVPLVGSREYMIGPACLQKVRRDDDQRATDSGASHETGATGSNAGAAAATAAKP